jgi:hypothetical protein
MAEESRRPGSPRGERKGAIMTPAIRRAVVAGLALALGGVPGSAWAQDEEIVKHTHPTEVKQSSKPVGTCEVSDPCEDIAPGAASMEPDQAIEEDPGTKAHKIWVESIWNAP